LIAIIDYGAGNLRSVSNAISHLGYSATITSQADEILGASAVVFPGVGAAGDTMASLKKLGLTEVILQLAAQNRPLLGVCLGLQVLLAGSEEGGWQPCLNILAGRVRRLPESLKIPHMGWNQVDPVRPHGIFDGIPAGSNFYFVHSYFAEPEDKSLVIGQTDYGLSFCSVLARGNLVATQFHPEKSGDLGLRVYDNFLRQAGVTE
jgi:imidazole glycerol-phosphate synthase subunit HisH